MGLSPLNTLTAGHLLIIPGLYTESVFDSIMDGMLECEASKFGSCLLSPHIWQGQGK